MEYIRPSLDKITALVVSDYEQLLASGWRQDADLYVRRGGHFVIRLLQDCYAANGMKVFASGIDSSRYTEVGKAKGKPNIRLPSLTFEGQKILVVDDVADEADTLLAIRDEITRAAHGRVELRFMTLYKKPWAKLVPDFWAEETDKWINFPWEPFEVLGDIMARRSSISEKVKEIRKAGFRKGDLGLYLRVVGAANRDRELVASVREMTKRIAR